MTCGVWQRNFGSLAPFLGFGGFGGSGGCGCGGYGSLCDNKNAIVVSGIRAGVLSGDFDLDKVWY